MPAFDLVTSIEVDAPIQQVRDTISNFETWPAWSPWLFMEPECTPTYKGTAGEPGHGYDWDGRKIGSGGMVLTSLTDNRMDSDLQFLKPFKSQAKVGFDFKDLGENRTEVSWSMGSSLPFFMFFMVNKMKAFIKNDYDRGLRMLKDYLEQGSVPTAVSDDGIVEAPAVTYVGKRSNTTLPQIAESMGTAFLAAYNAAVAAGSEPNDAPMAIYHHMDLVSGNIDYTAAVPVAEMVNVDGTFECSNRAATTAYRLIHTGAYRHLGNAWAKAFNDIKFLKRKPSKNIPPMEVYKNDPDNTPENELITEIVIPLKG
jgi:effector-binding domain-containing protein